MFNFTVRLAQQYIWAHGLYVRHSLVETKDGDSYFLKYKMRFSTYNYVLNPQCVLLMTFRTTSRRKVSGDNKYSAFLVKVHQSIEFKFHLGVRDMFFQLNITLSNSSLRTHRDISSLHCKHLALSSSNNFRGHRNKLVLFYLFPTPIWLS